LAQLDTAHTSTSPAVLGTSMIPVCNDATSGRLGAQIQLLHPQVNSCKFSRFATACVNHLTLPCVALILKSAVTKVIGGVRRRLPAGVNNAPEDANKLFAAEASELKKTLGRIATVDPNAGVALVWAFDRATSKMGPASCLSRSSSGPSRN
jgi:hypothetical protein